MQSGRPHDHGCQRHRDDPGWLPGDVSSAPLVLNAVRRRGSETLSRFAAGLMIIVKSLPSRWSRRRAGCILGTVLRARSPQPTCLQFKAGVSMRERVVQLREAAARWRVHLIVAAAALFAVGLGVSIGSLDLAWNQASIGPALLILGGLGPLTLVTASISLRLSATAVGRQISFRDGLSVSAIGSIAELLPLPGGAMVRGAALMRAGAGIRESTWIVMLSAVLTLSMATALGSAPLIAVGSGLGYLFLVAGSGGTLVSVIWIARRARPSLALAMVALRLVILVLGVARVSAAFAAIGLAIRPVEAALFVISSALGSTVSIVPAGLGISEAIAAALALLVEVPPAAAFVAVALNRILGLLVSGTFALLLVGTRNARGTKGP